MVQTTPPLESILVWVVCRALFFFFFFKLLMFPFKGNEETRHLVEAFCKLLIHKACRVSPAASLDS